MTLADSRSSRAAGRLPRTGLIGLVTITLALLAAPPASAAVTDDPPEFLLGPSTESIVLDPGSGGYWTGFAGVGVRAVLGAPDLWEPPEVGATQDTASNAGGIVVPNLAGSGYWVVAASGTIHEFGGAPVMCLRSMSQCGTGFSGSAVAAAAVPNHPGGGFWVVNDDGHVYGTTGVPTYGDWTDGGHVPVAIVATPSGQGYYILEKDGGIANKGDAPFFGAGRDASAHTWTGMALSVSDSTVNGYWTITTDGTLYPYPGNDRQGYAGASSLDLTNGTVTGLAGTPDGTGFAILQQSGQVTVFPNEGNPPKTTNTTVDVVSKTNQSPGYFDFVLNIRNDSSRNVDVTPYTSGSTNPRSNDPGFESTATGSYAALPNSDTISLDAGATSATWPVSAQVFVSTVADLQTDRAAEIQFDVTPLDDSSDRQRVSLTQPRQVIMRAPQSIPINQTQPWTSYFQLLSEPRTAAVGSDSLVFTVEEAAAPSDDFAGSWTLVIKDSETPATDQPHVPVTQLTAPFDPSSDEGEWAFLSEPIYRVDVPAITRTWQGEVPGRIVVEPAVVSLPLVGEVGTLLPTSEPRVDLAAKTVTIGPASFYYQRPPNGGLLSNVLFVEGGWVGAGVLANLDDAPAQPVVPADALLASLSLEGTTSGTAAVPANGLGAQKATLALQNNGTDIGTSDPLAWLYDHVFFVDDDDELITGLGPVDGSGYTAVTPVPAAQVVTTQELTAPAESGGDNVWLTSSIPQATSGLSAHPMLSVLMADSEGGGPIATNLAGSTQLDYATYDSFGSSLSGNLTSGVEIVCAIPNGSEPCAPILPTTNGTPPSAALYRIQQDGSLGPIRIATRYDVLLSPNDKTARDGALAMFDSALRPNASMLAVLSDPPGGSTLPSNDQNPQFSVGVVARDGVMVASDSVTLTSSPPTGVEDPIEDDLTLDADDPPSTARVGVPYHYVFDAKGASRYEIVEGDLPPGLVLDPATGELSGPPERAGTFKYRVGAEIGGVRASGALHTLTVAEATNGATEGPEPDDSGVGPDDGAPVPDAPATRNGSGTLAATGASLPTLAVLGAVALLVAGLIVRRAGAGSRVARGRGSIASGREQR